ncbi:MAG: hypothetical protein P8O70_05060 [SAR324 cluster bacterium]|nr:hypothetical protein [SAR324 cluster bacterium]
MHTDPLLRQTHPAFSLNFASIFSQKSIGVLLSIFSNALAFALKDFFRVATACTTAKIIFGTLKNTFYRAEREQKIIRQLPVRDRRQLIASMNALSGY